MVEDIRQGLYTAKIISYTQGYMLLRAASAEYDWYLNYGGLILLILALWTIIGGGGSTHREHGDNDPMSLAVSPLAIQLTLNPVGIVILVVASVEVQDLPTAIIIIAMILVIALIDLGVLYSADRIAKYLSHATVELLERVLGILLGALAVELIVVGLATLCIISSSGS